MKIHLSHEELEVAIREFVSRTGITNEVTEMAFSVNRQGGNLISTEITLGTIEQPVQTATANLRPVRSSPAATPVATSEPAEEPEPEFESADESTVDAESSADEGDASDSGKSLFG